MTLTQLRDQSITLAAIANHYDQAEAWAAGLVDAVEGGHDWRLILSDAEVSSAEIAYYGAGYAYGQGLIVEEIERKAWAA
jgi:hypothetical protein